MNNRRDFLKTTSLISLAPVLPTVVAQSAQAAMASSDEKVLVVIQLTGGNDGINTVVPFGDDGYARARKKLRQESKDLHKLNDHVGLHRNMRSAFELFDDGRLSIVQGVGYPNPDRSHFRSMNIWQTAKLDEADHQGNGWLGSALDSQLAGADRVAQSNTNASHNANAIFIGNDQVPVALWGRRSSTISLTKEEDLLLDSIYQPNGQSAHDTPTDLTQFVQNQMVSAQQAAQSLAAQRQNIATETSYPNTQLANQLKLVSKLLRSGNRARVFYTDQPGYDTHSQQESTHSRLLNQFSGAMKAFLDDMKVAGLDDRVVVLAFSEFGRRVAENSSAGTDHGSAGPVFLAGTPVLGGLVGDTPDLSDLVDGDLKTSIDFRRVYATLLKEWLDVAPEEVMNSTHKQLNLFS